MLVLAVAAARPAGALGLESWPAWLVWFLALCGLGLVAAGVWESVRAAVGRGREVPVVSLLLVVKDREARIEGEIRGLVGRYGSVTGPSAGYELVVVDDGSADDTPAILSRLEACYPGFLRAVRVDGPAPLEAGLASCEGRVALLLDVSCPDEPGGFPEAVYFLPRRRRRKDTLDAEDMPEV